MKSKNVKLYCKGGWEVEGVVVNEGPDRFILERESTYIVFKDSIAVVEILPMPKPKARVKKESTKKRDFSLPETPAKNFPENSLNYSEYQSILPKSMLQNYNEKNNTEPDLSISFGGSHETAGRINFGVKDESKTGEENIQDKRKLR